MWLWLWLCGSHCDRIATLPADLIAMFPGIRAPLVLLNGLDDLAVDPLVTPSSRKKARITGRFFRHSAIDRPTMRASCSSSSGRSAVLPVLHDQQQIGAVLQRAEVSCVATVVADIEGHPGTSAHRSRPSKISLIRSARPEARWPRTARWRPLLSNEIRDRQRFHLIAEADEAGRTVAAGSNSQLEKTRRATREHIGPAMPPAGRPEARSARTLSALFRTRDALQVVEIVSAIQRRALHQIKSFRRYLLAALSIASYSPFGLASGAGRSLHERWRFSCGQLGHTGAFKVRAMSRFGMKLQIDLLCGGPFAWIARSGTAPTGPGFRRSLPVRRGGRHRRRRCRRSRCGRAIRMLGGDGFRPPPHSHPQRDGP